MKHFKIILTAAALLPLISCARADSTTDNPGTLAHHLATNAIGHAHG